MRTVLGKAKAATPPINAVASHCAMVLANVSVAIEKQRVYAALLSPSSLSKAGEPSRSNDQTVAWLDKYLK